MWALDAGINRMNQTAGRKLRVELAGPTFPGSSRILCHVAFPAMEGHGDLADGFYRVPIHRAGFHRTAKRSNVARMGATTPGARARFAGRLASSAPGRR